MQVELHNGLAENAVIEVREAMPPGKVAHAEPDLRPYEGDTGNLKRGYRWTVELESGANATLSAQLELE